MIDRDELKRLRALANGDGIPYLDTLRLLDAVEAMQKRLAAADTLERDVRGVLADDDTDARAWGKRTETRLREAIAAYGR